MACCVDREGRDVHDRGSERRFADILGPIETPEPVLQSEHGEVTGGGTVVRVALQSSSTGDQREPNLSWHATTPLLATPLLVTRYSSLRAGGTMESALVFQFVEQEGESCDAPVRDHQPRLAGGAAV